MKKILTIIAILITLLVPNFSARAEVYEYRPLEPTFFNKGADSNEPIQPSTIFETLYTVALWIAVVLAVLMIVIAGVEYTAGGISESAKSDAKHRIQNALIGLFLALFAYLFLKTLNPELVGTTLDVGGGTITRSGGSSGGGSSSDTGTPGEIPTQPDLNFRYITKGPIYDTSQTFPDSASCTTAAQADTNALSSVCGRGNEYYLHTIMYGRITGLGIEVNRPVTQPCLDQNGAIAGGPKYECTSLNRLPEIVLTKLKDLKTDCNCVVRITGATEPGHTSHGINKAIVDLNQNQGINMFICRNGIQINVSLGCHYYNNALEYIDNKAEFRYGGSRYRYEYAGTYNSSATHWHVVVQ